MSLGKPSPKSFTVRILQFLATAQGNQRQVLAFGEATARFKDHRGRIRLANGSSAVECTIIAETQNILEMKPRENKA